MRSEPKTKEQLAQNLSRYGITVDDVYLTNIAFSPEYTAAIEAKQVAAQQVEQQRQILEQKRVQADQAEADALGRARAAVVAEARGQAAQANRELAESISRAADRLPAGPEVGRQDAALPGADRAAMPA